MRLRWPHARGQGLWPSQDVQPQTQPQRRQRHVMAADGRAKPSAEELALFGRRELARDASLGDLQERCGVPAVGAGVPDSDDTIEVEGGDRAAIWAECDVVDRIGLVEFTQR